MPSLAFAKLVATPTDSSWSQVYNAGNLFVCVSLTREADEEASLNSIGKDLFSSLQSEFFTLEDKNLQSIKESIANSTHTIPSTVTAGLSLAFFKENILYVFIYGLGTIIMKRGEKIGTLLAGENELEIKSASGFMQNGDTIILQTSQFARDMSDSTVSQALDLSLPNDIAEVLSPTMHESADGGQAAIIITYHDTAHPVHSVDEVESEMLDKKSELPEPPLKANDVAMTPLDDDFQEESEEVHDDAKHKTFNPSGIFSNALHSILGKKSSFLKRNFNHRSKLFLSVAVVILIILIASISLTKKKEENTKTTALFQSVYDPALKDYEDGKSVQSINSAFAQDDFIKAKGELEAGKDKFKTGSKEEKQITDLLLKVNSELGGTASTNAVKPKEVGTSNSLLLSVEKNNTDGFAFASTAEGVYFINDNAVVSVDKDGKKKDVIKNNNDWDKPVGIATYQGNIYVLDQKNGVLKFTTGSDGFGKSQYFKSIPSNISSSTSLAIDGSIWVLLKDGSILKYTRGVSDGFRVKTLDKQFKNPTRLVAGTDLENLYVLDPQNARIVKISKEGDFKTQYSADILRNAKDLEVSEKDGTILVLSQGKLWELPL